MLAVLGLVVAASVGVIWYRRSTRWGHAPTRARTTLASATDGVRASFVGRVHAGPQIMTAPVSGRACVAFRVDVLQRIHTDTSLLTPGRTRTTVKHLATIARSTEFYVQDETARAVVDITRARWNLIQDAHDYVSTAAIERLSAVMTADGMEDAATIPWLTTSAEGTSFIFHEAVIEPGEFVELTASPTFEAQEGYRDARGVALRNVETVTNDPTKFECPMPDLTSASTSR